MVAGDTDLSKSLGEATLRWFEQISKLLESVRVYQRDTSDKVSEMGEAPMLPAAVTAGSFSEPS